MRHHGQAITIDGLPRNHRELRGLYHGESEEGCLFQLYVQSGTRQATGTQLMRAHVSAMSRGRPMSPSDMRVEYDEIYMLIGRGSRMDIRLNSNGTYSHGNVFGRDFPDIVKNMIKVFGPRYRPAETREDAPNADQSPAVQPPKPF